MKTFNEFIKEDLRNWFDKDHPEGGWKRINSKGEAIGPCAREPGEPKPKCMSNEKRASLSKKERAAAVASKRKHDPNPERKGEPINVSNYGKGKISEDWQDVNRKDKTDGLSQKAVNAYRRENPGSKLQTAVTEKNPTGKRKSRRASFCARMGGMKKRLTNPENARDPDSPINKALRRWRC